MGAKSRIGKKKIEVPQGVAVSFENGIFKAKGPKGELLREIPKVLNLEISGSQMSLSTSRDDKQSKSLHGTYSAHIQNMISGVSQGWEKSLEIVGTGYRSEMSGNGLSISVGFSHPVKVDAVEGIIFTIEKNIIKISGIDKELVGQTAASIRALRPPEPYKGKGIRYVGEQVRKKAGKAGRAQAAA